MRVFLLCWELAPYGSGDGAAAGRQLVDGLLDQGIHVTCVLPEAVDQAGRPRHREDAQEAEMLIATAAPPPPPLPDPLSSQPQPHDGAAPANPGPTDHGADDGGRSQSNERDHGGPVSTMQGARASAADPGAGGAGRGEIVVDNPYTGATRQTRDPHSEAYQRQTGRADDLRERATQRGHTPATPFDLPAPPSPTARPGGDTAAPGMQPRHVPKLDDLDPLTAAQRFARRCVELAKRSRFDLIHAIGPETLPAGVALAAISDRPLVAHLVTACDAVPETLKTACHRGLRAADRVLAQTPAIRDSLVNAGELKLNRIELLGGEPKKTAAADLQPEDHSAALIASVLAVYRGLVTATDDDEAEVPTSEKGGEGLPPVPAEGRQN